MIMTSVETASDSVQGQDDSGCVQDEPAPCNTDAEPPPQVNLLDLSDDVLLWILQYCEACDLKALGYSCRRLGLLVCDRSLWCRVRAGVRPCGSARLRWFLALMHAQTRALTLAGHALSSRKLKSDQDNSSDEEACSSKDRCGYCDGEIGSPSSSSSSSPLCCAHALPSDPWRSPADNSPTDPRWRRPFYHSDDGFEMYQPPPLSETPDSEPIYTATPALLKQLATRCPQLHTLELTYCNVDWSLTNMSQFPTTLKVLSLRGCRSYRLPADKSCMFRAHKHLPLLEDLDLSAFDGVEGVTLLPLSKLPALRRLRLRNCTRLREFVAYASLSARYGFRQLQVLDVRGSTFSDSEMSAFGWLPLLEELYISPEHSEEDSPFPPEVAEREFDAWEHEEPALYRERRLPSPAPDSPPRAPAKAVFTVTIDRAHDHRRVNLQVDENGGGDGDPAAGDGNGGAGGAAAMELGQDERLARNGVRRSIRGRDVIFFVGGNPEIDGLPGNIGGEGNVIIVVGARNDNRNAGNDAEHAAPRNDEPEIGVPRNDEPEIVVPRNDEPEIGVPRNDAAEIGVPRNDAPEIGVPRIVFPENCAPRFDAEIVDQSNVPPKDRAQRLNVPEISAPKNNPPEIHTARNQEPEIVEPKTIASENFILGEASTSDGNSSKQNGLQNSNVTYQHKGDHASLDYEAEDGSGDAPPAKRQRMSESSVHSNDNSMEGSNASVDNNVGSSNASLDNNAGSSNDAGPASAAEENRPRRYVKFRRNLPPVVVTENEPGGSAPLAADPSANDPPLDASHPGLGANHPGLGANHPGLNANRPGLDANVPSPSRANEGQIRQPNPRRGIHVQRPLQNHRFFVQIENEHLENDRPYRRWEYRTPLARHARRIPGCLLGLRAPHRPVRPALLVTDATLSKFGRSDDEREHVIRLDGAQADGHSTRPNKSRLKRLVCSGYERVTNRSLSHLATAAPELAFVDVRGTKVDGDGVRAFKALRPDCEVLYDTVVVDG